MIKTRVQTMELIRLVRGSGFFLSSVVTASIGIMLLEIIKSTDVSLFWMVLIVPIFFGSLVLRSRVWLSLYRGSGDKFLLALFTALVLIPAGTAIFILFAIYASSQTILLNPAEYTGVGTLVAMGIIWSVYSLMEMACSYNLFKGIFALSKLISVAIVLADLSLAFLMRVFVYALPIAMFLLAASTLIIGLGFALGKERMRFA